MNASTPGPAHSASGRHEGAGGPTRPVMLLAMVATTVLVLAAAVMFVLVPLLRGTPSAEAPASSGGTGEAAAPASADEGDEAKGAVHLTGEAEVDVIAGEPYTDPGCTATNSEGEDISSTVTVDVPALNHRGDFTVTCTATDVDGTQLSAQRTVHVVNQPAPADYASTAPGLPILMYHDVFDADNPPADANANMIEDSLLADHIAYFVDNNYYFPTWDEVRDYVDGTIMLPAHSVVMTFDDGSPGFREFGVPLLEAAPVRATAFIITSANGQEWASAGLQHVDLETHSHDMHRAGGSIGHGGILTALSHDEIVADLRTSSQILGGDVKAFAYPFGDTDENSGAAVKDAGLLVAMTTKFGKAFPGDDPYYLPRVRVSKGESAQTLAANL